MNTIGIAIVGIDCRYPGANTPEQYWENILSLRQQFRRIPDKRLNLDYYFSDDKSHIDYTYSTKASVLTNYHFGRIKYRVSKSTFEQTDMAHWLALDVAYGALKDAGFENGDGLNKTRTGVILGNSLNGEFTRANILRLRWPYMLKVLESSLAAMNYSKEEISKIITGTEKVYKAPFPKPNADTLAGGLSNTIAGRICNYFDFNGGGFTIDGACASSLLAFVNGCNAIVNKELDVALVGGVDLSIDPFEMIGFARNGALASQEMEVYSTRSAGFWPGEGCGIVVLMNEEEALKRGLNIYSVIRGWGISSDGGGGVTRPKSETQQLAFERAYQKAGYDMSEVALFEGHGTGTTLGDKIELTALVNSLKEYGKKGEPATLGSVKHLIGHTKAAAGVAGLIKASLALKNRIIPASRKSSGLHEVLENNAHLLKLGTAPTLWEDREPMKASVSSMGFGGINVHLTMEAAKAGKTYKKIPAKVKKLSQSHRDSEIFPIAATTAEAFIKRIEKLTVLARDISRAELTDLSATICESFDTAGRWKVAVVAATPDELKANLEQVLQKVSEGKDRYTDIAKGIFMDITGEAKTLAFLFPGQGAPIYKNLGAYETLCKNLLDMEGNTFSFEGKVADTSVAQPAIVQRTLQSLELLTYFGVDATYGIGHSLGEISALSWAGVFNSEDAEKIACARGASMSTYGESGGAMLALKCDKETAELLIADYQVDITGYNGKNSIVIGGRETEIQAVSELAFEKGIQNVKLQVSHAFHTSMMRPAAQKFKKDLSQWSFEKPHKDVFSTVCGSALNGSVDYITHLYRQIEAPVKFTQAVSHLIDKAEVLIETGPGKALTRSLEEYEEFETVALDFGSTSFRGLLNVLAIAHISGQEISFGELNHNRYYQPFDLGEWELDVLVNPCEKTEYKSDMVRTIIEAASSTSQNIKEEKSEGIQAASVNSAEGVEQYLKQLISHKTELPEASLQGTDRILSELHLNSLAITEIISVATKDFNKSQKVFSAASIKANSDGTITEISEIIFKGETGNIDKHQREAIRFNTTHNWTQAFRRIQTPKKAGNISIDKGSGTVTINGTTGFESQWEDVVAKANLRVGDGSIFIYRSDQAPEALPDFLTFLKTNRVKEGRFLALVNIASETLSGDLRPLLRSFCQEIPSVQCMYLELHTALEKPEEILVNELKTATGYKEICYDSESIRTESEFERYPVILNKTDEDLGPEDVILATGGGKGITFESVRELASVTGAKVAILGRAVPEEDAVLSQNLDILRKEGITFHYCQADVCDEKAVVKGINEAVSHLGTITVLLHGAGINTPKSLSTLTYDDFKKTLSVKYKGIENVVRALEMDKMKLAVGFGSIIAQIGMKGNADYAWANDQLAIYLQDLGKQYPSCRCFTLEWSVWDETGMGVALNSVDTLKKEGVWPIPVKQALHFIKATVLNKDFKEHRLIISGRFGAIPTLVYAKDKMPLGRFISRIRNYVPAVEIVSDVAVHLNDDIYLKNHVFQNQYVFPTVMILEGVAQLMGVLVPDKVQNLCFRNLQIHKSIFIPEKEANTVRFVVTRVNDTTFKAVVHSEDSGYEVNCFELDICLDTISHEYVPAGYLEEQTTLPLDVERKFYDDLLFHHGPFRRITSFLKITATESIAKAHTNTEDAWFGAFIPDTLVLGDPGLNDAAIHCHQACRPGFSLLPTGAKEIYVTTKEVPGPLYIHTRELYEENNVTVIDVCIHNAKGEVKQSWKSLALTKVSGTAFNGVWEPHFLTAYLQYEGIKRTGDRLFQLPLQSCQHVVENLKNGNDFQFLESQGYQFTLAKSTWIENSDDTLTNTDHEVLEIIPEMRIDGINEPVSLRISHLNYSQEIKQ